MLVDAYKRPIRDLRISVTDRCNFRCTYCMPLDEYEWIDKKEILTFEEITRLARLFVQFVAEKIESLSQAGLRRVNISIDTLDAKKFKRMTKRGDLNKVLEGIFAAKKAGLAPIKLNAVIERGVNDDDILPLVEFSREHGFAMRFIEYMDVGNSNNWTSAKLVSKKEIIEKIAERYPLKEVGRDRGSAPSVDYEFVDGRGDIGVIASVTEPFCSSCTRIRLTADGRIVTCLFSQIGHNIKSRLRGSASDEEISEFISNT